MTGDVNIRSFVQLRKIRGGEIGFRFAAGNLRTIEVEEDQKMLGPRRIFTS